LEDNALTSQPKLWRTRQLGVPRDLRSRAWI